MLEGRVVYPDKVYHVVVIVRLAIRLSIAEKALSRAEKACANSACKRFDSSSHVVQSQSSGLCVWWVIWW